MKKFLLIIVSLIFSTEISFSQEHKLSIEQSIVIALENSKDLKISDSKVRSNEAKIKEVTSQFLPQFKLNAGYTRLSNVDPFLVIIPFSPMPVQISEVLLNNYNLRLSLQQQLFTGYKLSSLRNSATLNMQSSKVEFDNERNNVAYNVQISYWNYYKSIQIKTIADENVVQSELHVVDTKNFLTNGLATNSDLLKLEVLNSNAKLQQLEAYNNIDLARISFNKILGLPLESNTEPGQESIYSEIKEFNLASLINEAKDNRYELKALDYKIKSANENINAARSSYYPSVFIFGNAYYSNPNLRIQPPRNTFDATWDLGVQLSWDVWNWGNTSSQVTQAEQILLQNKLNYEQLKESIELEVNQNYLNVNYLKERIEVIKKTIEQSSENYRVTKEIYNVQLATSTDLADAETSLFQSQINYTNALIDYKIALLKLYKAVGRKLY